MSRSRLGSRPRIRPPGISFIPTLGDLIIGWYRWDDVTIESDHVQTVTDLGARGNNLARPGIGGASTWPYIVESGGPNGSGYIQHEAAGSSGYLGVYGLTAEPIPIHVFMVCRPMTTATDGITWLDGQTANTMRLLANGTTQVRAFSTSGGTVAADGDLEAWQLQEAIFNNGTDGYLRINGDAPATGNVGSASITGITVGYVPLAGFSADVAWTELLVTQALNAEQIAGARAELNASYFPS